MIVCPFNPSVFLMDIGEAFLCNGCSKDCRLLALLYPDTEFIFTKEDVEK